MKPKFTNDCNHNLFLGNFQGNDVYLYVNTVGEVALCSRWGNEPCQRETIYKDDSTTFQDIIEDLAGGRQ